MNDNLRFIKEVEWEEDIFPQWMADEENNSEWHKIALGKGWSSVRKWRENMASQFGASKRRWRLLKVLNPNTLIPQLQVGPFQGWHTLNYFKDSQVPMEERTFAKLAELKRDELEKEDKIVSIMRNFPVETGKIGLHFPNDNIVCTEGSHRSAAIALALEMGQPIDFSQRKLFISIAEAAADERVLLEKALRDGTNKPEN